jgi:hypothetical protein
MSSFSSEYPRNSPRKKNHIMKRLGNPKAKSSIKTGNLRSTNAAKANSTHAQDLISAMSSGLLKEIDTSPYRLISRISSCG